MRENYHNYREIAITSRIYFKLDAASGLSIRRIPNKEIRKLINKAIREFYCDGASHTWTTYRVMNGNGRIVDATMDDDRASIIFSLIGDSSYIIRAKYITAVEVKKYVDDELKI